MKKLILAGLMAALGANAATADDLTRLAARARRVFAEAAGAPGSGTSAARLGTGKFGAAPAAEPGGRRVEGRAVRRRRLVMRGVPRAPEGVGSGPTRHMISGSLLAGAAVGAASPGIGIMMGAVAGAYLGMLVSLLLD